MLTLNQVVLYDGKLGKVVCLSGIDQTCIIEYIYQDRIYRTTWIRQDSALISSPN